MMASTLFGVREVICEPVTFAILVATIFSLNRPAVVSTVSLADSPTPSELVFQRTAPALSRVPPALACLKVTPFGNASLTERFCATFVPVFVTVIEYWIVLPAQAAIAVSTPFGNDRLRTSLLIETRL